ncbi:MAG: radical SAM protein [Candidatus Bathyarchaeia archaeon]
MVDVLLVQPPLPPPMNAYVNDVVLTPPLGLCYIASCLREEFEVEILDSAILNLKPQEVKDRIRKLSPKVVGISTSTHTYKNALSIAEIVKENTGAYTVLGGPHVTFTAKEALKHDEVDFVIRNEGEITMLELCRALVKKEGLIEAVKGVSYRKDGEPFDNPPRPLICELDSLPFPARELTPLHLYKIPASIVTSRGCPSSCIFCAAKAMSGGVYRVRSPGNVVEEVKQIYERINPPFLFVADDTFTVFEERTKQICRGLKELGVRWVCESRVNTVNKRLISLMSQSGCFAIQFGVESGSQKILDSIKKGITLNQVKKVVQWCVEEGVQPVCSFMVPHPEDDWSTITETENLMNELKKKGAQIYVSLTTPFPGTTLYAHAEELGIVFLTDDTDEYNLATPVIRTRHLSVEDIERAFDRLAAISKETIPAEIPQAKPPFQAQ